MSVASLHLSNPKRAVNICGWFPHVLPTTHPKQLYTNRKPDPKGTCFKALSRPAQGKIKAIKRKAEFANVGILCGCPVGERFSHGKSRTKTSQVRGLRSRSFENPICWKAMIRNIAKKLGLDFFKVDSLWTRPAVR